MLTDTVGVTVNEPIPVFAAELKNLTAVGAVEPAGTATGRVIAFVAAVHVEPAEQVDVSVVSEDALVASVREPVVKVVEVIVRFQPPPLPRASITVSGIW